MSASGNSRRRLNFTSPPVSQSNTCTLCSQVHTQLSSPNSWKNNSCRQLALSLNISEHSPVCRPCRNDITRLIRDPDHHPRWEKRIISECIIPECKNSFFSKCSIPLDDIVKCLRLAGENIPSKVEIPAAFCKHHYHMVYNIYQPTQTNCPTCSAVLQKQNARLCPDVKTIRTYLAENTGYEGTLNENDKVCFACYKSHLHILKCSTSKSIDTDLEEIILVTKCNTMQASDVKSVDDAISRAMSITIVHVGEALLRHEGLLLPDIHNFFTGELNTCTKICASEGEHALTARWVLSNLTSSLQHHLSYVCKIRKCGTLLYRTNGDILVALTNALYKLSHYTRLVSAECNSEGEHPAKMHTTENTQVDLDDVNCAMQSQIQLFLKSDAICPYRFDQLDINSLVAQINPTLWKVICS